MPVFPGITLLDDLPGQIAQIFPRRVLRLTLLAIMKSQNFLDSWSTREVPRKHIRANNHKAHQNHAGDTQFREEWTELGLTAGGCLLLSMSHLAPGLSGHPQSRNPRGFPAMIAKRGYLQVIALFWF